MLAIIFIGEAFGVNFLGTKDLVEKQRGNWHIEIPI